VRGKLVANAVITVENRVFRLYNKLNKNNRFDVHCGDMRLNRDSLALQRTCLPEFVSYNSAPVSPGFYYAPPPPFSHHAAVDCWSSCYPQYYTSYPGSTSLRFPRTTTRYTALAVTPPAVVSASDRTEYAENVMRVIESDTELLNMAADLVGMYQEMDRVKNHYVKLREERRAAQAAKKAAARERAREQGRRLRPVHPRAL
jgi:hypothetical protein